MNQDQLNQKFEDRIAALEGGQADILKALEPVTDVFVTIKRLGKWGGSVLIFLAAIGTIVASVQEILRHGIKIP